jgi:hypothetical protein
MGQDKQRLYEIACQNYYDWVRTGRGAFQDKSKEVYAEYRKLGGKKKLKMR